MNRILGGLFETVHLVGIATVFGAAMLITWLTSPSLLPESFGVESALHTAGRIAPHFVSPARLIVIAALVAAILAPYLRADGPKTAAWLRVATVGLALFLLFVAWSDGKEWAETASAASLAGSDVEAQASAADALAKRSDKHVTPWNTLAAASGLNLVICAFQMYRKK